MSFFIRNKSKGQGLSNKLKRKHKITGSETVKKKKNKPSTSKKDDEFDSDEIPSEDETVGNDIVFDEDEIQVTAQEKKLQLAKKYLAEIEQQEKEKLESSELDSQVLVSRLREGVLEQAGKLKRKVADRLISEIPEEDICVLRCKDHKLSITCVVISSDSEYLYSGSKDATIVKWSIKERKKVGAIPPKYKFKENEKLHSSSILSLAVSHDNKYLASGDEGKDIRLWDAGSLEHVKTFSGHRGGVTGLSFCRFTRTLYSSSRDRTIKLWNTLELGYIETLFGHQSVITSIDVLAKDRAVSSGGTDNSVRVWKIPEESHLIYNGESRSLDCVRRLDDQHFISCSDDGHLSLWGVLKKKPFFTVRSAHGEDPSTGEPRWVNSIAALHNTDVFASGSSDSQVRIWRTMDNYRSVQALFSLPVVGFVNSLAFSADENHLVVGLGQEHRLGRWHKISQAKNSILLVKLNYSSSKETTESGPKTKEK